MNFLDAEEPILLFQEDNWTSIASLILKPKKFTTINKIQRKYKLENAKRNPSKNRHKTEFLSRSLNGINLLICGSSENKNNN